MRKNIARNFKPLSSTREKRKRNMTGTGYLPISKGIDARLAGQSPRGATGTLLVPIAKRFDEKFLQLATSLN